MSERRCERADALIKEWTEKGLDRKILGGNESKSGEGGGAREGERERTGRPSTLDKKANKERGRKT